MKEFILKSIVITICVAVLFFFFIPKYDFLDRDTRCNRITGEVERHSSYGGWINQR